MFNMIISDQIVLEHSGDTAVLSKATLYWQNIKNPFGNKRYVTQHNKCLFALLFSEICTTITFFALQSHQSYGDTDCRDCRLFVHSLFLNPHLDMHFYSKHIVYLYMHTFGCIRIVIVSWLTRNKNILLNTYYHILFIYSVPNM